MSGRRSSRLLVLALAAAVLGGCSSTIPAGPASQVSAGVVVVGSASGGLTVDDTSADMPIPATSASGAVDVPAEPDGDAPSGGLTIPRLGFDQPVAEEVSWGAVLRPVGRGLATVTDIPAPWGAAGQLYLIHSGGDPSNPGNLLVEKDGGSLLVVGDVVTLADGSPSVVTRAEVTPKDDLPEWLWTALAEGHTVLVTCRPESGRASSTTNAIIVIHRT